MRPANLLLNLLGWVLGLGVDHNLGAQPLRQRHFLRPQVNRRDVHPHGLGILNGHMPEAPNAEITTHSPGRVWVSFRPLYVVRRRHRESELRP